MDENKEEFPEFHFKNEYFLAKADAIKVVIFEQQVEFPNLGLQNIYLFLHKIPDAQHDGGIIIARSLFTGLDKQRTYDSYEALDRAFVWIRNDTIRKGKTKNLKPIYEGMMLRG